MNLEPITRLTRDERAAAEMMGRDEARFLVDAYYTMQDNRIRSANQLRALSESGEPNATVAYLAEQNRVLEQQVHGALAKYVAAQTVGQWATSQHGVGPVIAAGFLSNLDLRPTVGAWWRFCGLDPSQKWGKGEKRPWNAQMKVLAWKLGESFVKQSSSEKCFYGHVYLDAKAEYRRRNDAGDYAETAASTLETGRYKGETVAKAAYEAGRLPDAQIHRRAQRKAVKLFLAHLHHVMHEVEAGSPPPKPYVIEHMGHAHYTAPPGWPM